MKINENPAKKVSLCRSQLLGNVKLKLPNNCVMSDNITHQWESTGAQWIKALGPVVQSTISANPGLKFNPLFWFRYICKSVNFRTL